MGDMERKRRVDRVGMWVECIPGQAFRYEEHQGSHCEPESQRDPGGEAWRSPRAFSGSSLDHVGRFGAEDLQYLTYILKDHFTCCEMNKEQGWEWVGGEWKQGDL